MTERPTYYYFLPYIILYFFFNNAGLPQGLLYTTLLTPVFLYWLYKEHTLANCMKWSLLLLVPIPFQIFSNINVQDYIQSSVLMLSAWIFFFTALKAIERIKSDLEKVFFKVLILNTILVTIALILLPLPGMRDAMWNIIPISPNIPAFSRLNLFAYEPSHYALLLSPVFMFYGLKVFTGQQKHALLYLLAITIPLLLSLSFGVIGASLIAMIIALLIYIKHLPGDVRKAFMYVLLMVIAVVIAAIVIWPENPVWIRTMNIFSGTDTSAKGRLMDSFMFAADLSSRHNFWFGVGPGQVKILAHDLIINHYQYSGEFADIVRIPNSMGEMLATYGFYGFVLKIFFEIYFFIRQKIYNNLFSLSLFIFIFVYQFTGSFVMNIAELGVWAIVFSAGFERFIPQQIKNFRK